MDKARSMMYRKIFTALYLTFIVFSTTQMLPESQAAVNDWAEGNQDQQDGATRDYYNRGGRLPWNNYLGDWQDANGAVQGTQPYDTITISDTNSVKIAEWDITFLVRQWMGGTLQNQGVFLHPLSGSGPFLFHSREYSEVAKRPQLLITSTTGEEFVLAAEADTYLEASTYRSLGTQETLRLRYGSSTNNILLRFNLDSLASDVDIQQARLQLTTYEQYGSSDISVGAFSCSQGESLNHSPPLTGIAAAYLQDIGITDHPDVIFATGFETESWQDEWSTTSGYIDTVTEDAALNFESFIKKAFRGRIAEGDNYGFSLTYKFLSRIGYEPEEIYFRYYLRLADNWNQTVQSGKMPGISGTYGTAGWGGRPVDGTNGWSARGSFYYTIPTGNPLAGRTPLGTYCYHADMDGSYGDVWLWTKGYHAYLLNNQWHSVEQYLRMNTPGQNNGVIKAWVDGHLVFEKTGIRFRDIPDLKIEQIWMNLYHGGTQVSPNDQHLYLDNVVIAKSYIGPLAASPPLSGDRDNDGDVDGKDLSAYARDTRPNTEEIANHLGRLE